MSVTKPHAESPEEPFGDRWVAALQCVACNRYILGIVKLAQLASNRGQAVYEAHYPLGEPDFSAPDEIPQTVATDYVEALRCHWADAPRATVIMCGRALQTSCNELDAKGNNLSEQIDDLTKKQLITKPLKQMADRIRLFRNRGGASSR